MDGLDSDQDGLSDFDESEDGGYPDLDPSNPDTDGDGVLDGIEVLNGYDPSDPNFGKTEFEDDIARFIAQEESAGGNTDSVKETIIPLFWVYYPHAREILKKGQAFNNRNTSKYISFDDIINSRRFNSVIYKEENVYENREVKDYIKNNAFMRLLESERIKEKIRNFEHDMWSW